MEKQVQENTGDLVDLFAIYRAFYNKKRFIALVTLVFGVCSVIYALILPNIYESSTILTPNSQSNSISSRMMGSQFGGLASLAGIALPSTGLGDEKAAIAIEMLGSKKFFADYLYEDILVELMASKEWDQESNQLVIDSEIYNKETQEWIRDIRFPQQKKPSIQEAHISFMRTFSVEEQELPFYEISVRHVSPLVAMKWNKLIMESINNAMRDYDIESAKKAINFLMLELKDNNQVVLDDVFASLIEQQTQKMMLADIAEEYVFRTIDPAVISEQRASPKRKNIVILGTIIGFLFSVIFVFFKIYSRNKLIF